MIAARDGIVGQPCERLLGYASGRNQTLCKSENFSSAHTTLPWEPRCAYRARATVAGARPLCGRPGERPSRGPSRIDPSCVSSSSSNCVSMFREMPPGAPREPEVIPPVPSAVIVSSPSLPKKSSSSPRAGRRSRRLPSLAPRWPPSGPVSPAPGDRPRDEPDPGGAAASSRRGEIRRRLDCAPLPSSSEWGVAICCAFRERGWDSDGWPHGMEGIRTATSRLHRPTPPFEIWTHHSIQEIPVEGRWRGIQRRAQSVGREGGGGRGMGGWLNRGNDACLFMIREYVRCTRDPQDVHARSGTSRNRPPG